MSETITCPSGLSGRIRGMKAREERILADRAADVAAGRLVALDFRASILRVEYGLVFLSDRSLSPAAEAALLATVFGSTQSLLRGMCHLCHAHARLSGPFDGVTWALTRGPYGR